MSKICIGVISNNSTTIEEIYNQIEPLLKELGLGCFFNLSYNEPALKDYSMKDYLFFSIADSFEYDNCEMLLLPDECLFNNRRNPIPFTERLTQFKSILELIFNIVPKVELFIGDSGTLLDEFQEKRISITDFMQVSNWLNSEIPVDLHLIITRKTGDGFA